MTEAIMTSNLCREIYEPPKLADYNVIVTNNRQTGVMMYYFIRKFRTIDVYGDYAFGGNISSHQLTLSCDHVMERTGNSAFKVVKCRGSQDGNVALRLMADYLASI